MPGFFKHWSERFRQHRGEVIRDYGEQFYRKWEFYLISCEMGFRYEALMVYQIQLSKKLDAVPLTRDYMYGWERTHQRKTGSYSAWHRP